MAATQGFAWVGPEVEGGELWTRALIVVSTVAVGEVV